MRRQALSCSVSVDDSFGPWAQGCRGGFDFTLLFEESILAIPVLCLFIIVVPFRMAQLGKTDDKISRTRDVLRLYKVQASICLALLQLVLMILWTKHSNDSLVRTRASIPTAVLAFVAALGFCILSWYEHSRSVRPSSILDMYLSLSILFDVARTRTLWLLGQERVIAIIFTCTVALRVMMIVLESTEKRSILTAPYRAYPQEATSGAFSRSIFFWLSSLFYNGYTKVLTLKDLFPLDTDLYSEGLHSKMETAWNQVSDQRRSNILFKTWLLVQMRPILSAALPRLCLIGFTFAQPFLITKAIEIAAAPNIQPYNNYGYGLIGAYVLVYLGIAVSTGQYEHRMYRAATMMRGSIIPSIHQKTLALDASDINDAAALTLISTDIETIVVGIVFLHETWASLIELGVAIWLLERQLGAACAIPVSTALVSLIIGGILAVPLGKGQAAWIAASQKRVSETSKVLENIKWLRLSGLNDFAFSRLDKLRGYELDTSRKFRILLLIMVAIAASTSIINPILTFVTFAGIALHNHDTLTISKAFTSLSLFALLAKPLSMLMHVLPPIASTLTSFKRIQDYLTKERPSALLVPPPASPPAISEPHLADEIPLQDMKRAGDQSGYPNIVSVHGLFQWPEADQPVIDVDLFIRRHAFTLLIGPVGCGKTTLLKALLDDLKGFNGTINTSYVGVAYAAQTPWIPNGTVREVITGTSGIDDLWLREVVHACDLNVDIQQWPEGDDTVVGSKGVALSGGQKHRLAIARAAYSKHEFLVLDDVFSGLDATTENAVFHNLLGPHGLLRKAKMTVVLASSNVHRAPFSDEIVVMDSAGKIAGQGTFDELRNHTGRPSGLSGDITHWMHAQTTADRGQQRTSDSKFTVLQSLLADSDARRQLGDSEVYKYYFASAGRKPIVIFAFAMAVFAFGDAFPNVWLKWWAQANAKAPNTNLDKWLGVYAAIGVISIIALFFGVWQIFVVTITRSGLYFHRLLRQTVSRASMDFFSTVDNGITINRFSQDLQLIDMELPASTMGGAICMAFVVAQAILMSVASKYFAIVLPVIFGMMWIIQKFYLRTSRQMRLLDIEHKAPLYTQVQETLSGLTTIRAFQWERERMKKHYELLDESQRPFYLLYCLQRWLTFSADMVIAVMAIVLITLVVTLREQIGPGFVGIALVNIMAFGLTTKGLILSWVNIEISIGAVARIKNFVASTKSEGYNEGILCDPPENWPTRGHISIQNVDASYPSSGKILQDISMTIETGQKIGVCGRTGSGKSSLASTLFRMLNIDNGCITIDNIDISTLIHEQVRSALVSVPQEIYLFNGTVRLNVDPSEVVTDERVIHALQTVQLWPVIERRGGLDVVIDDKFFSQGQVQLLGLARAMVRKGSILILDEPTSSLDEATSAIIKDVVGTWFKDWTVIAIAHKLESIVGFDKIAVMDQGRLLEFDTPMALLGRDSAFRELYEGPGVVIGSGEVDKGKSRAEQ